MCQTGQWTWPKLACFTFWSPNFGLIMHSKFKNRISTGRHWLLGMSVPTKHMSGAMSTGLPCCFKSVYDYISWRTRVAPMWFKRPATLNQPTTYLLYRWIIGHVLGHVSQENSLTHICVVDPSILINWNSPFPILGVSGVLFHFNSISNRYSC